PASTQLNGCNLSSTTGRVADDSACRSSELIGSSFCFIGLSFLAEKRRPRGRRYVSKLFGISHRDREKHSRGLSEAPSFSTTLAKHDLDKHPHRHAKMG